jgi:hypothetical protein
MRPECKPLMFASMTDAAWYLGKQVCQSYEYDNKDRREQSERLIYALLGYFIDHKPFVDLLEIFECAKRHAEGDDAVPFSDEQLKVVK